MTRPTCVHCGKRYGRRATTCETIYWDTPSKAVSGLKGPRGETGTCWVLDGPAAPPPPYRGNGVHVRDAFVHLSGSTGRMTAERYVWDGASWVGGYNPAVRSTTPANAGARNPPGAGSTSSPRITAVRDFLNSEAPGLVTFCVLTLFLGCVLVWAPVLAR